MKIIITTVGSSLLTNLTKKETIDCFDFNLESEKDEISSGKLQSEFPDLSTYCQQWIQGNSTCCDFIKDDKYNINLNASAEIKSICKIANGEPAKVYLICTDTFVSEYCAKQVKKHLEGKAELEFPGIPKRVEGLDINKPDEFQNSGFENLVKELDSIYETEKNEKVLLNISGGYKALIPFLTIYGQLKELPIKYIYENSNNLISIGKTPLNFDWEIIEQNYLAFEKFGSGPSRPNKEDFLNRLSNKIEDANKKFQELVEKGLIIESGGKIALTFFGLMYYKAYGSNFHSSGFNRKSLHSKLIEYMVYEYYQKQKKYDSIKCGFKPNGTDYDIDVYLEDTHEVVAIEVKPGGNIPIKKRGRKNDHDTIEYKLTEGSFKHIVENNKGKNIILRYICYSPFEIHKSIITQIEEVLSDVKKWKSDVNSITFQVCHLCVPNNYKSNTNWPIRKNSIKILLEQSLKH